MSDAGYTNVQKLSIRLMNAKCRLHKCAEIHYYNTERQMQDAQITVLDECRIQSLVLVANYVKYGVVILFEQCAEHNEQVF